MMKVEAVSMAQNDAVLEILPTVKKLTRRERELIGKPLWRYGRGCLVRSGAAT
jgi:hypothetical protein